MGRINYPPVFLAVPLTNVLPLYYLTPGCQTPCGAEPESASRAAFGCPDGGEVLSQRTCAMCGAELPQRKMIRWSGNPGGAPSSPYHEAAMMSPRNEAAMTAWWRTGGRWGKRGQWVCRDGQACQQRQMTRPAAPPVA